jgi:hypothetical protein
MRFYQLLQEHFKITNSVDQIPSWETNSSLLVKKLRIIESVVPLSCLQELYLVSVYNQMNPALISLSFFNPLHGTSLLDQLDVNHFETNGQFEVSPQIFLLYMAYPKMIINTILAADVPYKSAKIYLNSECTT